jgi:uridylate kinase
MPETPKKIHDKVEIAIVIGGGNIFRGVASQQRNGQGSGNYMGMLPPFRNDYSIRRQRNADLFANRVED